MILKKHFCSYTIFVLYILFLTGCGQNLYDQLHRQLEVNYTGDAKIEVGGPFVGVEFHHSYCVPQRISFFYPVANSIDLSSDYWKRDTTYIMALGLKIGDTEKEWLGFEPYSISLTPYRVRFWKKDSLKSIEITYQFTKNKPSMIITYEITNRSLSKKTVEFDTHLETSLRTSHTFMKKNRAWTDYDSLTSTIYTNHLDKETQRAQLFVTNAGELPVSYHTAGPLNSFLPANNMGWEREPVLISPNNPAETATRFFYRKELSPGETLKVIQITGSAAYDQGHEIVAYLRSNFESEIDLYEHSVLDETYSDNLWDCGDPDLNHSLRWAKAILASNAHYLDGEIVPMPCPAEYNFYFTHDVLVTDLAAVYFDTERVRRDLDFIIRHANEEKVIPHAYYWRDSSYVTEYADSDNWNNFWMIITSASYLRHSADTSFIRSIFPYIKKCMQVALLTRQDDYLMWSFRPDWWDIGKNYGPRSYMTILAIKALREYIYIASVLGDDSNELNDYEKAANSMQMALADHLWSDELKYLINYYQDHSADRHYYIGSLLAAHYQVLEPLRQNELINTAKKKLVDEKVGVYNAYPMDFENLIDYLKFSGNEAGAPFYYFNGGVWYQGNAWYTLGLIAIDRRQEAYNFVKRIMTLNGIMNGPNGQPAMYEVRNANHLDTLVYGTVDKPQFMWAGGWYLYCLYHLFCITEDHWNISFSPYLPQRKDFFTYDINLYGKKVEVCVSGTGQEVERILYDEGEYPSIIVPANIGPVKRISIHMGSYPLYPYIKSSNSNLVASTFNHKKRALNLKLKAFPGHQNKTIILTPYAVRSILCDGKKMKQGWHENKKEQYSEVFISAEHQKEIMEFQIEFYSDST